MAHQILGSELGNQNSSDFIDFLLFDVRMSERSSGKLYMGKEGERLKSHARASAHHAAGAVDGESPTPQQASQPQPQTTTMTDAKMLQLVSMLEKSATSAIAR